jgi:hypothetical protein
MPRKKRELGVQRPQMSVLPDSALVRDDGGGPRDVSSAEPTHEVSRVVPYFLDSRHGDDADGVLARGARVTLIRRHASGDCRVRDESGREVYIECAAIKELR